MTIRELISKTLELSKNNSAYYRSDSPDLEFEVFSANNIATLAKALQIAMESLYNFSDGSPTKYATATDALEQINRLVEGGK